MQYTRIFVNAFIASCTLVGSSHFAHAQPTPGCPLIPIPDAQAIADPDRERFPYPPPAPVRISDIERTNVDNLVSVEGIGNVDASYCLYSPPLRSSPLTPKKTLLLYNHGFQFGETGGLDAMLQYIANSGYYVVYPYIPFSFKPAIGTEVNLHSFMKEYQLYPTLAFSALRDALTRLQQQGVGIDHVAVAGHSLGGIAAVRVAARWAQEAQSPGINAIILHEPAGLDVLQGAPFHLDTGLGAGLWARAQADLSAIRCQTYLLIILAEDSEGQSNSAAKLIWNNLPQISKFAPSSSPGHTSLAQRYRRNLLMVRHDVSHGALSTRRSDHVGVVASPWYRYYSDQPRPMPLTSLDYHGYWRPLRGGLDMPTLPLDRDALYDPYCNAIGPQCTSAKSMGRWGDGVQASEKKIASELSGLISTFPDQCP
jgi:pimeloyl-ACP methyl ester carboxylesterase